MAYSSLHAAFPLTSALDADVISWEAPFSWSEPDFDLLEALWAVQVEQICNLPDFWAWSEAMVADLNNARTEVTTDEADAIDCARFITCIPALHSTRAAGQLGACWNWIWTAIAPNHIRGERINANTWTFVNFPAAPPALYDRYLRDVPQFTTACFYLAYKSGGLDELSSAISFNCWQICSRIYEEDPGNDPALDGMAQMVIWAAHRNRPEGQAWADKLTIAAQRTQTPRQRLQVAMTFITVANRYVRETPQERAEQLLREHGAIMREHERLQAQAVALQHPTDWKARREEILTEIARLRTWYISEMQSGHSDLEVIESRVSIIHPLFYALVNGGEINSIIDLLGAWYRADGAEPADTNVLVIVPSLQGGAAYIWPGGSWLTGTGDTATHDMMQRAAGRALGQYLRGSDGDHDPHVYEEFRFDVVDTAAGHALEAAMAAHYKFDELRQRLPPCWIPRAILVFPSGSEPLQGMLAKATGLAAPLEVSFQRGKPLRPVQRISVWASGGLLTEQFEINAIRHIAQRAGWEVDVYQSAQPTSLDFRKFYEDNGADVAWVISHGAHDPFSVRGTGLDLGSESFVGLEEIRSWRQPTEGRRLLVLNSCSGADAQGRGGIARIGLAPSLVSGYQAVVGHLWLVHWTTGLAFGAALAASLETNPTEAAVLDATRLLREPQHLFFFLEERFQGCHDLLDRLHRAGEDLTSITNWGCPVLLT